MSEPTRLAIHGASGRMGIEVLQAARNRKDCRITAALVRAASTWIDEPLSRVLGSEGPDLDFIAHLDPEVEVDVIVDFSTPDALETALSIAQSRHIAFVCGTTGLDEHQFARLRQAAEHIPVLWGSNFSLGVALLKRMAALAAAQLGPEFEAEILEIHHRSKRDAPSGTALALGRAIADARQHAFEDVFRYARHGTAMETRASDEIGFAVLRAADVVGEHTVMFASEGERIEITHRANSRGIFATGAVRSAIWLARQPPGWYDVSDVLG